MAAEVTRSLFETARQYGVTLVRNLAEDARTTSRWYLIVSMGRAAGHLALGIGKAAAATLIVIPEEFNRQQVSLDHLCDILLGSIIINYGVLNERHVVTVIRPKSAEKCLETIASELGHIKAFLVIGFTAAIEIGAVNLRP